MIAFVRGGLWNSDIMGLMIGFCPLPMIFLFCQIGRSMMKGSHVGGGPSKNTRSPFYLLNKEMEMIGPQYFFLSLGFLKQASGKGTNKWEVSLNCCCCPDPPWNSGLSSLVFRWSRQAIRRCWIMASTWVNLYHAARPQIPVWLSGQACLFHSSCYPSPYILGTSPLTSWER